MDECASVDEAAAECCQQLGMADVDPGCGAEPAEMPNEPEMLITMSIQSEGPDSGDISCMYLGGSSIEATQGEYQGQTTTHRDSEGKGRDRTQLA